MVMMSNWPPLVAMSVVMRWRSTFSSRTTQFSLMPVVLLELRRQLLHDDHVAVVHGRDRQRGVIGRLGRRCVEAKSAATSPPVRAKRIPNPPNGDRCRPQNLLSVRANAQACRLACQERFAGPSRDRKYAAPAGEAQCGSSMTRPVANLPDKAAARASSLSRPAATRIVGRRGFCTGGTAVSRPCHRVVDEAAAGIEGIGAAAHRPRRPPRGRRAPRGVTKPSMSRGASGPIEPTPISSASASRTRASTMP